jgi:uncharacterized membrane protein
MGVLLLLTAVTLLATLVVLVQILWLGRRRGDGPGPDAEEMRRHLLWGAFYLNLDDPRGWVPKITGFGWTVNFRSRRAVIAFLLLLAVVLACSTALTVVALAGIG